ncbi:MAG: hypothetical protein KDB73_05060 [Planctomycetes bacterium]|nr:hypothetical protein [Planctomycetota bacterium]
MSDRQTKHPDPIFRAAKMLGWERIDPQSAVTLMTQFVLVPVICVFVFTCVGGDKLSLSLISTVFFGCLVMQLAMYVGALLVAFILTPSPQRERRVD